MIQLHYDNTFFFLLHKITNKWSKIWQLFHHHCLGILTSNHYWPYRGYRTHRITTDFSSFSCHCHYAVLL